MTLVLAYTVICGVISIINAASSQQPSELIWTKDKPVAEILGAEDAIYCRITGPDDYAYYDGFGKCQIFLNRALPKHEGIWNMRVGLPGRVVTDDSTFNVKVVKADPKPIVETQVVVNKPTVSLSCSVSSSSAISITSCAFRHTSGRILIANEGTEEDRFAYYADESYNSDENTHQCGLLITNPLVQDLGLWRCAIDTEGDVYYGFLKVLYPGVTRDPEETAAIITEPILRASRYMIVDVAGNSVSMSCSIHSAISYCYFRSPNGTVYNISPGNPHEQATYIGAGFDAGECGIRFYKLASSDSGSWSCHVGLVRQITVPEQQAIVNVTIHDPMVLNQRMEGSQLIIETQVYDNRPLDYCRFVRSDGFGFTFENLPDYYRNLSFLSQGRCGIAIEHKSLESFPWTIVAKIKGQGQEISVVSRIACGQVFVFLRLPSAWIIVVVLSITILLLAALLGTKKNREWTYRRTNEIRNSFRRKTDEQKKPEAPLKNATASAA